VVSRLTWQKGMDLLLAALPVLLRGGAQLAMLGSGDADLEHGFAEAARRHPGRVGARIGYDEALAADAAEEKAKERPFVREMGKIGRNDPCPCGSGKKYKKCHGAEK